MKQSLNVLAINTSAKKDGSISRTLTADLLRALEDRHAEGRRLEIGQPCVEVGTVGVGGRDGPRQRRHPGMTTITSKWKIISRGR